MATLEELKNRYEAGLRRREKEEGERKPESFFETYRHAKWEEEEPEEKEDAALLAYQNYVEDERACKEDKLREIEEKIAYQEFFLRFERNQSRSLSQNKKRVSTPETRYRIEQLTKLEEEKEQLLRKSPEAFLLWQERKLKEDLRNTSQGRLVDVPHVLQARKKIAQALEAGIPVYLVGHLGSGKTQLAEEAATDYAVSYRLQAAMEEEMQSWYQENPGKSEAEAIRAFGERYRAKKAYFEELVNSRSEEGACLRPLFISGSHNLTYEDMFVEKSLKLAKNGDDISYEEYLNRMADIYLPWLKQHREELEHLTKEEQLQLKIQTWHSFSSLFIAGNSNFGTVVEKLDRELLTALKEGRPIIIDELNTIAMQNLIALNDILQRQAGSTAYVTGVGPVRIEPGFCFIGTGNLSSDSVNYEGTNTLNPAFQSRFLTIEYNYMPQTTIGSLYEQKEPEKNELFRVIIEHLCGEDGGLCIPEPGKTLDELFRFAQLARKTQMIFEGRLGEEGGEEKEASEAEAPVLNEAVFSIRNIIHVLDHWNYGEEEDLSMALWQAFISCITNPDDLNFILSLSVRYGFFTEEAGWKIRARAKGEAAAVLEEIYHPKLSYTPGKYYYLSRLDVVHLLFGQEPKHKKIPEALKAFVTEKNDEEFLTREQYEKMDADVQHLLHSKDILDYITSCEEKN